MRGELSRPRLSGKPYIGIQYVTDSYWYESKIKMTYEGKKRSDGYDYVHHGPWVSKTGRFVASVIGVIDMSLFPRV